MNTSQFFMLFWYENSYFLWFLTKEERFYSFWKLVWKVAGERKEGTKL